MLEHKNFRGFTKSADAATGIVDAAVAVTGNVDDGGDVIVPGGVKFTRQPKVVNHHEMTAPVGKVLDAKELMPGDPALPEDLLADGYGALMFKMQFNLDTQRGREAFSDAKFFEHEQGWSIGYHADVTEKGENGTRLLKSLTVWEASPVTFGMNAKARTLALKSAVPGEDKVYVEIDGSIEKSLDSVREAVSGWWKAVADAAGTNAGDAMDQGWWVSVQATFADSALVAVYEPGGDTTYWSFPYTKTDGGVALGEPTEVEVQATIVGSGGGGEPPTPDAGASIDEPEADEDTDLTDDEKQIIVKAGRVLASRNEARLRAAADALTAVLAELPEPEADNDDGEKTLPFDLDVMAWENEITAPSI